MLPWEQNTCTMMSCVVVRTGSDVVEGERVVVEFESEFTNEHAPKCNIVRELSLHLCCAYTQLEIKHRKVKRTLANHSCDSKKM